MKMETKRLILRPWTENDAEVLYKYASDPEVGPSAGWAAHTSVEHSLEVIRTILSKENTFAMVLKDKGEPIGSIGLFRGSTCRDGDLELGYWIGKPFWGLGLVPEACIAMLRYAFGALGCRRVWCAHFLRNDKSRRVIEKCGFHPVCYQRDTWPSGERLISRYYVLYKEERRL